MAFVNKDVDMTVMMQIDVLKAISQMQTAFNPRLT